MLKNFCDGLAEGLSGMWLPAVGSLGLGWGGRRDTPPFPAAGNSPHCPGLGGDKKPPQLIAEDDPRRLGHRDSEPPESPSLGPGHNYV